MDKKVLEKLISEGHPEKSAKVIMKYMTKEQKKSYLIPNLTNALCGSFGKITDGCWAVGQTFYKDKEGKVFIIQPENHQILLTRWPEEAYSDILIVPYKFL